MTLNRWIQDIIYFWRKAHPPLAKNKAWRAAREMEAHARRRGCTQAIGRARKAKRAAILAEFKALSRPVLQGSRNDG